MAHVHGPAGPPGSRWEVIVLVVLLLSSLGIALLVMGIGAVGSLLR
jgi:hypothetical protein